MTGTKFCQFFVLVTDNFRQKEFNEKWLVVLLASRQNP